MDDVSTTSSRSAVLVSASGEMSLSLRVSAGVEFFAIFSLSLDSMQS